MWRCTHSTLFRSDEHLLNESGKADVPLTINCSVRTGPNLTFRLGPSYPSTRQWSPMLIRKASQGLLTGAEGVGRSPSPGLCPGHLQGRLPEGRLPALCDVENHWKRCLLSIGQACRRSTTCPKTPHEHRPTRPSLCPPPIGPLGRGDPKHCHGQAGPAKLS